MADFIAPLAIIVGILILGAFFVLFQRLYISIWKGAERKQSAAGLRAARVVQTSGGSVATSFGSPGVARPFNSLNVPASNYSSSNSPGNSGSSSAVYTIPVRDSQGNTSFIVVQSLENRSIFIEPLSDDPPPSYEDCMKIKNTNYTAIAITQT